MTLTNEVDVEYLMSLERNMEKIGTRIADRDVEHFTGGIRFLQRIEKIRWPAGRPTLFRMER